MRNTIVIIVLNLILVLFQNAFLIEFFGTSLNPNLIVAIAFAFILADDDANARKSVFIGGIFTDLLNTEIFGLSVLFFVGLLQISIILRKTLFKGQGIQFAFVFISTILYKMLFGGFNFALSNELVISGTITILLSALMAYVIKRFQRRYVSSEYRIRA